MAAKNDKALGEYVGNAYIRPTGGSTYYDMGAIRALVTEIDATEITEINSDNRGNLRDFANMKASVTFTALEVFSRETIDMLFTTVSTNVAGTATPVTGEVIGTSRPAGTIYTLLNRNGAKTQVASIVVSHGAGALTLGTNYTVGVDANGFTYIVFITATTGATTVNYTYTPNASESAEITLGTNVVKRFDIKIETILDNGKARTITLSPATLNAKYSMSFQDAIEANDVGSTQLVFDGKKGSKWNYYDENI